MSPGVELLTPKEMAEAEEQTIAGGIRGIDLMRRAGAAVAELVQARVPVGSRITVLAGPGNNGGDGFVVAAKLAEAGYPVRVGLLASRGKLAGDAAVAANDWLGQIEELTPDVIEDADLIVDALFGAGLARAIEGRAATVIAAVNESDIRVVAVDLPSGIDGSNGHVLGIAIEAQDTVTFFRCKPGHLLMPGRKFSGQISLVDIGIEAPSLEAVAPNTFWNIPPLWRASFPTLADDAHKYNRGHVIVVSGPMTRTGAARLAARGALRIGAGLVSVASPPDALATHAAHLTAIMILKMDGAEGLRTILADERRNAVVLGPALGVNENTRTLVTAALGAGPAVVLDADALSAFAGNADRLCELTVNRTAPTVLTPHDGEFSRLFPDLAKIPSKLDRARAAAIRAQAVIVAKGPDTVVAAPDGRASIASNAPPELATAGSGDVLAGMIGGLLAQKMPVFEAATAAVWMHGAAARTVGRGLIAEDLAEALPNILSELGGDGD
jgi:ADP-dependent NAD(P)H-hydrate dehydratase / NAD(P)H-hydrate epimerase